MTRAAIGGAAIAIAVVLVLVALTGGRRLLEKKLSPAPAPTATTTTTATHASLPPDGEPASEAHQGYLYGRVTTSRGAVHLGRLRWGGSEEAFWGDTFYGWKAENPWAAQVPAERLQERRPLEIFGVEIAQRDRPIELSRPFMARFGDIARIEPQGRDLQVILKSGTLFHLDRFEADDLADGIRVWDGRGGVVDLDEREIRSIELLPTARLAAAPGRLHGTVRTRHGDFRGFVQWNRRACVGADELTGRTTDGELRLRFDSLRSIARASPDSSRVTLLDGRELVLSGAPGVGEGNRGVNVDDPRYGRVLVSWEAFEGLDFNPGGSGPAYDDFPPGQPLAGAVTTRSGRHLAGRLVFDLDESETTESLDAPFEGVHYTIPFGLVASIVPAGREGSATEHARVTLHAGEELRLERRGDLGPGNAGLLIFLAGRERPEYVPWAEVEQVELDRPSPARAPVGGR